MTMRLPNFDYALAMQELRRSNATVPIPNKKKSKKKPRSAKRDTTRDYD